MRKYEYYCDHKKFVDLYGSVNPNMLLTKKEVINIKAYLDEEDAKRLALIEQHENTKSRKLVKN